MQCDAIIFITQIFAANKKFFGKNASLFEFQRIEYIQKNRYLYWKVIDKIFVSHIHIISSSYIILVVNR